MGPERTKETRPIRWRAKDGAYDVTLRFVPIEGRMECIGVDVRTVGPRPRPVTAAALHSLPLGKLVEKRRGEAGNVAVGVQTIRAIASVGKPVVAPTKRRVGRPPKYGGAHWEAVAMVYVEAYSKDRTPTRAVARHFSVSESAAAKWVAKCRSLGLLPPTRRGIARAVIDP